MDAALIELVDLLTSGNMEADEREEALQKIAAAPSEFDWASSDENAYALGLIFELDRHAASGDKLDEVHEQLQEMMGDEFPAYPHHLTDSVQYHQWLDRILAEWSGDGGYDVVAIEDGSSDNMHLFVPYRRDTSRILELADQLGIPVERPLDYWRRLGLC